MSQILASAVIAAPESLSPWRNRIHLMPDGYRVVLYTDGTHVFGVSSATGVTWGSPGSLLAITSMGAMIDSVVVTQGSTTKLWIFVTSGSTILAYSMVYNGAGAFAAISGSTTVVSGLTLVTQSIRCAFDKDSGIFDSQHIGGNGVLFLVVDQGSNWVVYALDPSSSATGGIKKIISTTVPISVTSPTSATNVIVRKPGKLYICSPGSTSWIAYEITYATTTGAASGPTSFTATALGTWYKQPGTTPSTGISYEPVGTASGAGYTPIQDTSPGGSWGYALTPAYSASGGTSVSAGSWAFSLPVSASGFTTGSLSSPGARVYKVSGGAKTLIGTLTTFSLTTTGISNTLANTGGAAITGTAHWSGAMAAHSFAAGDSLYVEPDIRNAFGFFGSSETCSFGAPTLTTPTSTGSGTTITGQSFSNGSSEVPNLPVSAQGAAVILADITADPALTLLVEGTLSGTLGIYSSTRSVSGSYSNVLPVGSTPPSFVAGSGCSASFNSTTGEQVAFTLATFSSVVHVAYVKKSNGGNPANPAVWGTWARLDGDFPSLAVDHFIGPSASSYAGVGPAIVYTSGTGTYTLRYEDASYSSSAGAPTVTGVGVTGPGCYGVATPFNVTNTTPELIGTYNDSNFSDGLGSYEWIVAHGSTDWDSGVVAASIPRLMPGGQLMTIYGSVGAAPITSHLVPGSTYTVSLTCTDSVGNLTSSPGTATVFVYSVPVITVTGPNPISSLTLAPVFDYAQAESVNGIAVAYQILDPVSLLTLVESGQMAMAITAGSTGNVGPSFDLTPYLQSRVLLNNQSYILQVTAFAQPPQGQSFPGLGQITVPLQIPASNSPHDVSVFTVPGFDPLAGGYADLAWVQDAGSGSNGDAAGWNIYLRNTILDDGFVLIGKKLGSTGTNEALVYSIPNGIPCQLAISSFDANGVESSLTICPDDVYLEFHYGLWMNQADSPTLCVELGIRQSNTDFMEWEFQQDKDVANMFNRTSPVITTGPLFTRHASLTTKYVLETGFELQCKAILERWMQLGTLFQLRDPWGNMIWAVILTMKQTSLTLPTYQTVEIEFQEADDAGYIGLVV